MLSARFILSTLKAALRPKYFCPNYTLFHAEICKFEMVCRWHKQLVEKMVYLQCSDERYGHGDLNSATIFCKYFKLSDHTMRFLRPICNLHSYFCLFHCISCTKHKGCNARGLKLKLWMSIMDGQQRSVWGGLRSFYGCYALFSPWNWVNPL